MFKVEFVIPLHIKKLKTFSYTDIASQVAELVHRRMELHGTSKPVLLTLAPHSSLGARDPH